ncbi:MAG: bifunctional isocitrate dehydrogenase kinase/phosphatase [Pseudomonadales bacterium]|nr:bifunctional isocitrate dehydrogenase kinase/phosphatase [Pseudomonadales bacterium]
MMTDSQNIAEIIFDGFNRYFSRFQEITNEAQFRFENALWQEVQEMSAFRIDLYKDSVIETLESIKTSHKGSTILQSDQWKKIKSAYSQGIQEKPNIEIAETYFNSIVCSLFDHQQIDDEIMFIHSTQKQCPIEWHDNILRRYRIDTRISMVVERILDDIHFNLPYENKARDIRYIVYAIKKFVYPKIKTDRSKVSIEVLKSIFFRNKGAYIVGRALWENNTIPFVLPILNNENGTIYIDTVIFEPDDVSIIFSFTRSYFMVSTPIPSYLVNFLKSLIPHKGLEELYNSIGFNKHGKTEFYRNFIKHLEKSEDKFVLAPGIKGMVMTVFTLPSFDIVFKVIKDRFDPPKEVTHAIVREKYKLVSRHDRVGRMADTQEYAYFRLPLNRCSDELLEELKKVAPSALIFLENEIVIKHLYTERKMIPLNLYLQTASESQIEAAMDEYGNAIKQISSANIFPGDMLLKNFGVTRHGRVVFYDYDEICFLDECHFRKVPTPQTEEQEMASSPWYHVDPCDVFPEEFCLFFTGNPSAKKAFEKHHKDLYTTEFWLKLQEDIAKGKIEHMFPYRRNKRFSRTVAARPTSNSEPEVDVQ